MLTYSEPIQVNHARVSHIINDASQKAVVTFFLRFFFGLRGYGGKAAIRLANALCAARRYSAFYAAIPAGYAA